MINIGGNIGELYVGNIPIEKAYIGSQLVWEKSSPLPEGVIPIEYLESQGNCYIQTTCIPSGSKIAISAKFMFEGYTSSSNYIPWYSAYVNDSTQTFRIVRRSSQICVQNGSVGIKPQKDAVYNPVIGDIYEIETNGNSVSVNGSAKTTRALSSVLNTNPLVIFNNSFKGRCYYFKVYDNNIINLDLIPARVGSDGYMYDRVSKQLFGNSGTGSFALGPDVT